MPDQWLEVMVTGGFKVWHIIFIIIAFVVTIIVVYCCFHRCRIPRTKQEIEADLMRMNITNKFRDYLQEFPNEPTTFIEALKKVQELEEKSEKNDAEFARDSGARKRMGWLKLKGKNQDKEQAQPPNIDNVDDLHGPIEKRQVTIETEPRPAIAEDPPTEAGANSDISKDAKLPLPTANCETLSGNKSKQQEESVTGETTKVRLQQRRRKQKPNLSRTKRAREQPLPQTDSTERLPISAPQPLIDADERVKVDIEQQQQQVQKKKVKEKSTKDSKPVTDKQPAAESSKPPPRAPSKHRKLKTGIATITSHEHGLSAPPNNLSP